MRKSLSLLAFALLVSTAHAGSLTQASAYTTATFSATAGLTLDSVSHEAYNLRFYQLDDPTQFYQSKPGVNLLDLGTFANGDRVPVASTDATVVYGYSTTDTLAGNRVSLSADAQIQMAPKAATSVVAEANRGHHYFFTYTNGTGALGHVTFDIQVLQSCLAHADVPFGDNPYGIVDYANPTAFGGVAEVTFGADGHEVARSNDFRILDVNTSLVGGDAFDTQHATFSHTFDIADGATKTFDVYAAADATVAHVATPVPEPASFLALGVGALALLRRRRKA